MYNSRCTTALQAVCSGLQLFAAVCSSFAARPPWRGYRPPGPPQKKSTSGECRRRFLLEAPGGGNSPGRPCCKPPQTA
eukprot:3971557-Alexandrium_andersonii.AAC.1